MPEKICVAIPTYGMIKSKTALSIIETIRLNDYDFLPIFQHGLYLSENREKLVEFAQNNTCSHIWFLDYDITFGHTTLPLLLSSDKDIIGPNVNYRRLPQESQIKFFGPDGGPVTKLDKMPDNIFKVAGIAGSMMLIKMSVFDKLTRPYFPMGYDEKGFVVVSEDIGFCEKVRDAGFDIWCDPTIEVKHYGEYAY